MKKILVAVLVIALAMIGATAAFAGISTTKHNLSTSGSGATLATVETEICIFCHTPHGGGTMAPLWNKADQAQTYGAYGTTKGGTVIGALPNTTVSYACMACHDGVSAMGAVLNTSAAGIAAGTIVLNNTTMSGLSGDLTVNMNNDHPVGFTYDATKASLGVLSGSGGNVVRVTAVAGSPSGLAGAKMECSSCHEPHAAATNFLRVVNTGSALCLGCHNK